MLCVFLWLFTFALWAQLVHKNLLVEVQVSYSAKYEDMEYFMAGKERTSVIFFGGDFFHSENLRSWVFLSIWFFLSFWSNVSLFYLSSIELSLSLSPPPAKCSYSLAFFLLPPRAPSSSAQPPHPKFNFIFLATSNPSANVPTRASIAYPSFSSR